MLTALCVSRYLLTTRQRDVIERARYDVISGHVTEGEMTHSHGVFPGQLLPLVVVTEVVVHVVSVQQYVVVVTHHTH